MVPIIYTYYWLPNLYLVLYDLGLIQPFKYIQSITQFSQFYLYLKSNNFSSCLNNLLIQLLIWPHSIYFSKITTMISPKNNSSNFIAHIETVKELSLAFRVKHKIIYIAKTSYPTWPFSPISCHSPPGHPLFQKAIMDFFSVNKWKISCSPLHIYTCCSLYF